MNSTGIKIKVAENRYAKVLGETDELPIEIDKKKVKLSFVVLEHNGQAHNGQAEKFVGTMKRALRKLSEKDHTKWPVWTPFIKLAYNTRKHTITKVSPFKLLFGMEANSFEDWSEMNRNDSAEDAILNRYFIGQVSVG